MSHYILDKIYTCEERNGLERNLVVAPGQHPGACQLPSVLGCTYLGVTVHSADRFGESVSVRKAGIAACIAAGPIKSGDPVAVTPSGRVVSVAGDDPLKCLASLIGTPPYTVECLGFAETSVNHEGHPIDVFIQMHQRVR